MTDLPIASRVIWTSSFLLAVATHVALVLPWLWHEPDALAGAGGQELDVISFVLAEPGVLETREVDQINLAVPAPADAVEEKEGSLEENQPKKEESKEIQEPLKPENEIRKPDAILEEAKPKPAEKSKQQEHSVPGARQRVAKQRPNGSRRRQRRRVQVASGNMRNQSRRRLPRHSQKALVRRASPKFVSPLPSRDGSDLFKL
jgi:outer membrane biosynthesis protein TonB